MLGKLHRLPGRVRNLCSSWDCVKSLEAHLLALLCARPRGAGGGASWDCVHPTLGLLTGGQSGEALLRATS